MTATFGPGGRVSVLARLRLAILLAFAIGSCLAMAAAWTFTAAAAREAYDRLLISAATQIAETVDVENGQVVANIPDAAFETLALSADDRFFYSVRDSTGRLVTGYPGLVPGDDRRSERPVFSDGRFSGAAVRRVTIRQFVSLADQPGSATITVAQTIQARADMAMHLLAYVGATIAFVSLAGLAAFLVLARQALQPLVAVEHALATRPPNDLSPITGGYPREIQSLIATINRMMGHVSERLDKLQALTAVAAHQIRTPLAALLAQVELLKDPGDPLAYRGRIDGLRRRLDELSRLANQLLGHAMVAYRDEAAPRHPVDLVRLVQDVANRAMPETLSRDVEIAFKSSADQIVASADSIMLEEAIGNLIDNALRHGAPSRIGLTVMQAGDWVRIGVSDDGPGIPRDQWGEAIQPFALTRDGSHRAGAGLGLSIASAVAVAHKGELILHRHDTGMFEVTIVLPGATLEPR